MKKMNKLTGVLTVALMAGALMSPMAVHATNTVDTPDDSGTATGTVEAEIKGTTIEQLKVTLPLKMDFVIAPTGDGEAANNKAFYGTYKLKNEGVALKITNIAVATTEWNVATDENALTSLKTVKMEILGSALNVNNNAVSVLIDEGTNQAKEVDMGFKITPSKTVKIQESDKTTTSQNAFTVVYTVERQTPTTPQP